VVILPSVLAVWHCAISALFCKAFSWLSTLGLFACTVLRCYLQSRTDWVNMQVIRTELVSGFQGKALFLHLRPCLGSYGQVLLPSKTRSQDIILTFGSAIAGMIVGQIRSLRNFGVIGSFSVYINLLIIFMSMGVVAHSLPNYAVANAANDTLGTGPVVVKAFITQDLAGQVNGMFK
jgi:hypothetical protein